MNQRLSVPHLEENGLTSAVIHLWYVFLDEAYHLDKLLSRDEKERAGKYHFERDRRHFIACRGILRAILARYLDVAPAEVEFGYIENGKPALVPSPGQANVCFNLSHSNGLAVYAFTIGRRVGVDIESTTDKGATQMVVESFFSAGEKEVFRALSGWQKKEAFFRCWTRKEAFLKATGRGLSSPLASFDVSLGPGEPARLLRIGGDSCAADAWSIQDLEVPAGFAAALAVEGQYTRIRYRHWAGEIDQQILTHKQERSDKEENGICVA